MSDDVQVMDLMASQLGQRYWGDTNLQSIVDRNCSLIPDRFVPEVLPRGPLAIVGYGPSLHKTWMALANTKADIWTVSGAHDFLIARGVFPTYHTDCEWRDHKVKFIKELRPDVRYIVASTAAENYVARLPGYQAELFHIQMGPHQGSYPEGEQVWESKWDVTQMVIDLAATMGYKEIHLFGIDYCMDLETGLEAAGIHHGPAKTPVWAQAGGWLFKTSTELFQGCASMPTVMRQYADIEFAIHGDGMLVTYIEEKIKESHANQRRLQEATS